MKSAPAASPSRLSVDPRARGEWSERSSKLFAELQRPARAMLRRAFRDAFSVDEIDDIYSGAWVGVFRTLAPRHHELSDDEVRSYVFTAVAHQAGKELRRRRRKPTAPLELVDAIPDQADGPHERADGAERSRITRDLLSSLPPRRRAVMLLRYGWGLEPRQICGLVPGLSPRAYRKEITRGVDELTEKVRAFERGDWCADRESLLTAYAAGMADEDERRQARAHLSHCRDCSEFVARLSGHLFDLSTVAAPATLHGLVEPPGFEMRVAEVAERFRDGMTVLPPRVGGLEEAAGSAAAAAGARGGGVAGAGLLAKLASLGAGGKLALACAGSGVMVTACVAAGVVPLERLGSSRQSEAPARSPKREAPVHEAATVTPTATAAAVQSVASEPAAEATATPEPRPDSVATEPPVEPVASTAPPEQQEFGVEAAAVSSASQGSGPSASTATPDGGTDAAIEQEFGGP